MTRARKTKGEIGPPPKAGPARWTAGDPETAPVPQGETSRLEALASLDILDTPPEEAYDRFVRLAAQIFEAPTALLSFVARDRQWFKARVGFEAEQTERCVSFCQFSIFAGEPLLAPNALESPRFADNPLVLGEPHIRFYAGVPIVLDGRYPIGTLCVIDYAPREQVEPALMERLEDLAALIVSALERRRTEREYNTLRERELMIRGQALDAATDGVAFTDGLGCFTYMNDAHARFFGFERGQQLVGKSWSVLYDAAERRRMQEEALAEAFTHGRWTGPAVGTRRDGTRFEQELSLSLMETGGLLCVTRDVTERKAMEERTQQLERELLQQGRMEALGALAGGLAHEINTPAQYIGDNVAFLGSCLNDLIPLMRGYRDALNDGAMERLEELEARAAACDFDFLADEVLPAIDQCAEGIARIREIVTAIKRYSHPGGAEAAFVNLSEAVDLAGAISVNQWKYVATLEKRLPDDLPPVRCNVGDVTQVLLNLIVNAAHAIEDAKRPTRGLIRIEARRDGDDVVLSVSDNGVGVAPDIADHIFDPFFTTKPVGRGSGQGLALSRSIVETRHQGRLSFESVLGEGTRFDIRLPIDGPRQA